MKPLAEMGRFKTVVVDPPWDMGPFGFKSGGLIPDNALEYPTMHHFEIGALDVPNVLGDDAWVFLWTVNRYLAEALEIIKISRLLDYSFTMTWVKNGGIQTPVTPQFNAEWCIVGRKGNPKWLDTKAFKTANYWPRGAHSEKPEGFYDLLRRVTPGPRLDIFGRRRIAGFYSWGDEAPEGEPEPDHYQMVL